MIDDIRFFADEIARARDLAKGPELFARSGPRNDPGAGELWFLRRWNSHTPAVTDVLGGGYFIRWRNRGTIIDPGCGFVRLLQASTPYGFGDIDLVITTHDHVDHCQDFGTLVILLRQFNQWGLNRGETGFPRTWDLILSHGVASHYSSILAHPENSPFLRIGKVLPPKRIHCIQTPPTIALKDNCSRNLEKWPPHIRELCQHSQCTVENDYAFAISVLPVKHRELLGENTSMGLRIDLQSDSPPCSLAFSGDTGIDPEIARIDPADHVPAWQGEPNRYEKQVRACDLVRYYADAHLIVLHVGTMEKANSSGDQLIREGEHLGLMGVVEILHELGRLVEAGQAEPPRAIVLSEWGYEFGRLGLLGRSRFTQLVVTLLESPPRNCGLYFPAIGGTPYDATRIPIIPADIGLRMRIPSLQVWCKVAHDRAEWVEPRCVRAVEECPAIIYEAQT